MHVESEAIANVNALEKDLINKLQTVLHGNRDEKLWPHNLFNSVGIYDIVILSAQQDRGVVEFWLWCKSQETLERLTDINTRELVNITEQLFSRFQSTISLKVQTASINSRDVKHDVVVRRLSAKLQGTLPHSYDHRSGLKVCALQDKIYVVVNAMLCIYEDRVPFTLLECKNLASYEIQGYIELAACPVNKCLYIAKIDERPVWKIHPAYDHQFEKWLPEFVSKLSVSSDGKVLVIDSHNYKLRIYTCGAELELEVPFCRDFHHISAIVELVSGVVAVEYINNRSTSYVIMRLNATGDILCRVDTDRISRLTPYFPGLFIAVDKESSQVIVVDSQLKPLQVILSLDTSVSSMSGLSSMSEWPKSLYYIRDTQELIVDVIVDANNFHPPYYIFNVYKLNYNDECE